MKVVVSKIVVFAFLVGLGCANLNAEEGCYTLSSKPGECFSGILSCNFNSTVDHERYGFAVGNLCDTLSSVLKDSVRIESSLSECFTVYNQVLSTQSTDSINLLSCKNETRGLLTDLNESLAAITSLTRENIKLRRKLRRNRS